MFNFVRAAVLAFILFAPAPVLADDIMKLPKSAPLVTFTLPEKWVLFSDNDEFDMQSPDPALYARFWQGGAAALERRIAWGFDFLTKNRITVDTASMKQTTGTVNGFPMTETAFDASDGLGPAMVRLRIVTVAEDKFVVMLIWCTPSADKTWGNALEKIMNSLTRLG